MTIGRRIVGSFSGMLILVLALGGLGIGGFAWIGSWHASFVDAAQQTGALNDLGLQEMLSSLEGGATILMALMGAVLFLCLGLNIAALTRLGPTVDKQLRAAVSSLSKSVSQLLTAVSEVAGAASHTAAATNQTTATVEEVKQTMVLAAEKAAETAELSDVALKGSKFGEVAARTNQDHFDRIREAMESIASAMGRLDEQVRSVGDIMTSVSDIAEQSNLLSVNASIEAAKVGDIGKGFTVVAQEVKSLAEQSKGAVGQVRTVLAEIQKASNEAAHAIEEGRETAERGTGDASQALSTINDRVGASGRAAESALQISATSSQQLAGIEQISEAVRNIDEAGNRSLSGSRRVEEEVGRLQELALSLKRLVGDVATEAS